MSDYFSDPESLVFLQRRVATFAFVSAIIGGAALLFRTILGLTFGYAGDELADPSFAWHSAAVVVSTSLWAIMRRGSYSERTIHIVEALGIMAITICFVLMGSAIPPEAGALVVTCFILSFYLFARAVFVPSTARHTALLGFLMWIPLVIVMYRHYLSVDLSVWRGFGYNATAQSPERVATAQAAGTVTWWSLTVGLATVATRVIHGLRQEVKNIQRLGQYTVEGKIGEGGMGVVYRATHGMLKRPTAVKLLRAGHDDPIALSRFRREVQLTAKLTHPNTVRVYDYGRTPAGQFYYAMELLEGANLQQIVEVDGPQSPARVAHILRHSAMALQEAHGVGLIHRDIKPSNIMLAQQGGEHDVVKVMDFGLVKSTTTPEDPAATNMDTIKGTPYYLSPEAIKNPNEVDAQSDLYALGAVGYFLLGGRHVFQADSVIEVCMAHLDATPEPLANVVRTPIPKELEQIVLRCLAKNKADRPSSAKGVAREIAQMNLGVWDDEDAQAWWQSKQDELKDGDSGPVTLGEQTIAVAVPK